MKAKKCPNWIRALTSGALFLAGLSATYGQTQINLGSQGRNVDFTNAPYTKPIKAGSTLPVQCTAGEFFLNTTATPGQNLFACLNGAWTVMAGQTGLTDPGTNGLLKRTGANSTVAVPAPTGALVGTTDVQTLTGKSIDASELNTGTLSPARLPALSGDITTPTGSTATALATVFQTPGTFGDATHSLQVTVDSKGRVISLSSVPIAGGTGSSSSSNTSVASGNLNAIPSTCSPGALYLSTDQPLGQQIYICSEANSWTPSLALGASGALNLVNGSLDLASGIIPQLPAANHFTGSNQLDGTTTVANLTVTGSCNGCNSTGFASPMNTLGDQIVGGTNGLPVRAPLGAQGQVWTVGNSGQPVWASLPAATQAPASNFTSLTEDANGILNITNSSGQGTSIAEHGVSGQGLVHTYDLGAAGGLSFIEYWSANDLGYGIFLQSGVNKTFERYHPQSGAFFTDLGIQLNTVGAQPTCDGNHRGEFWFVQAAAGAEDGLQVCHQTANGYAWKVVF